MRSLKRLFHHTPNLSNNRKNMEMMYKRKNNRGKIQIMGDVLALATSGIKKTHIMYRANLSLRAGTSLPRRANREEVDRTGCVFRWSSIQDNRKG